MSLICFWMLNFVALGQTNSLDTNKVEITPFHKNIYAEDANGFIIGAKYNEIHETETYEINHPLKSIVVKSSQGEFQNSSGLYWLSNLKPGKVTISVFKQVDTGFQLLTAQTFKVIKRPLTKEEKKFLLLKVKPIVSIEGSIASREIPIGLMKSTTHLVLNKPYHLKKAFFYVAGKNVDEVSLRPLYSEKFTPEIIRDLNRIAVECIIVIDEITVESTKGETYTCKSISLKVIPDNLAK